MSILPTPIHRLVSLPSFDRLLAFPQARLLDNILSEFCGDTPHPAFGHTLPSQDYNGTVVARIKRDRNLARALYAEALRALTDGEIAQGLSMLRDSVPAQITVTSWPGR
jgi:hypothetical protein